MLWGALISSGLLFYPLAEGWNSKLLGDLNNGFFSLKNEHLLTFILRMALCKHLNVLLIMCKCSFSILLYISMSSRYARYLESWMSVEVSSSPKRS